MERLLGKTDVQRPQVVEYCVVCGDKASGQQAVVVPGVPGDRHHGPDPGGGGSNVTVLFFIGMMMSISRSGCQIIGIKRKSQETVSVICKSWLTVDYFCTSKKVLKISLMVQ